VKGFHVHGTTVYGAARYTFKHS